MEYLAVPENAFTASPPKSVHDFKESISASAGNSGPPLVNFTFHFPVNGSLGPCGLVYGQSAPSAGASRICTIQASPGCSCNSIPRSALIQECGSSRASCHRIEDRRVVKVRRRQRHEISRFDRFAASVHQEINRAIADPPADELNFCIGECFAPHVRRGQHRRQIVADPQRRWLRCVQVLNGARSVSKLAISHADFLYRTIQARQSAAICTIKVAPCLTNAASFSMVASGMNFASGSTMA